MLHIPLQPCQTGLVKTGMAKRLKQKSQRSLIDCKLLEQRLQNALQDRTQDTTQDAVPDKQETDLINCMQDLMLKRDQNMINTTDISVPPLDTPEMKHKEAKENDPIMMYNMTNWEARLQCEEEKCGIYMNTFGYKGDNSNLDSEADIYSNATAYLFLS